MKENLLHFIWKLKLFSVNKLTTVSGKKLEIISVGEENKNTGPDFLTAKISIDNQLWVGTIEIHVNASDWYLHHHEKDTNYDAVILHVVWEYDAAVFKNSNEMLETLVLKNYIDENILDNYKKLFNAPKKWINCEKELNLVDNFIKNNWIERLFFERLEEKSIQIDEILKNTSTDWEATLFVLLAKNFGLKVNEDAFLQFATSFDFSIVRKVSTNLFQLEALFLGQAGLLNNKKESEYYKNLREEYNYLCHKFKLVPILDKSIQFFRLRPSNFPTIRLAQLASLYVKYQNLFSKIIEIDDINDFYKLFSIKTSEFWETHYTFETGSKKTIKNLTKSFIDLLLINTLIPLKFSYLKFIGNNKFDVVLDLFSEIKPEKNIIISKFKELKVESTNAFETQALLQLKNKYCNKKLCLQCAFGKEILKP